MGILCSFLGLVPFMKSFILFHSIENAAGKMAQLLGVGTMLLEASSSVAGTHV